MIFSLLPVKTGLVLSMDRTTGSSGVNINNPLCWATYIKDCLPFVISAFFRTRGNSNWEKNARKIMGTFYPLFRKRNASTCLVAGRECIGKEWTDGYNKPSHTYYIRIRQNFWIVKPSTGERIRAWVAVQ